MNDYIILYDRFNLTLSVHLLSFTLVLSTSVNGWEEHYGDRSFIYQCRNRFGDDIGYRLWEVVNQTFD